MSGLREIKKKKTRQAIMNAAIKLFSEKGFKNTSVNELAKTAGVGKSTIYGYFHTKNEIFLAFCEDQIDFVFTELAQKRNPDAPLKEQLWPPSGQRNGFSQRTDHREVKRHF